jgi:hypothetical protein
MKNTMVLLVLSGLLSACAIGVPKTVDEFKELTSDSSFAKALHFPIEKGSLKDVEGRLNEYSERCLNIQLGITHCGTFTCQSHSYGQITAHVEKDSKLVRLIVQKQVQGTRPSELPEGGMYILIAEADGAGKSLQGHVYAPKIGYGDLLGSTKGWLTGEAKTCPAF